MKITEIKATIVAGSRPWVYVRVATDEGLYGLAEAYPVRGVIGVLHSQLKELLIGQDPLAIEPLYNHLLARTPGQSTGGTTDDPMARVAEEMEDPFAIKQGAASEEETRIVMERYEQRRRRMYDEMDEPDPYGLITEDTGRSSHPSMSAPSMSVGTGSLAAGAAPNWLTDMERKTAT